MFCLSQFLSHKKTFHAALPLNLVAANVHNNKSLADLAAPLKTGTVVAALVEVNSPSDTATFPCTISPAPSSSSWDELSLECYTVHVFLVLQTEMPHNLSQRSAGFDQTNAHHTKALKKMGRDVSANAQFRLSSQCLHWLHSKATVSFCFSS